MELQEWVGLLGNWASGEVPMYKLLAEALQRLMLRGEIPAGNPAQTSWLEVI